MPSSTNDSRATAEQLCLDACCTLQEALNRWQRIDDPVMPYVFDGRFAGFFNPDELELKTLCQADTLTLRDVFGADAARDLLPADGLEKIAKVPAVKNARARRTVA